ncbi:MAG: hypothetical protein ACU0BN_01785, partial [Sulfitobacter sp.]
KDDVTVPIAQGPHAGSGLGTVQRSGHGARGCCTIVGSGVQHRFFSQDLIFAACLSTICGV